MFKHGFLAGFGQQFNQDSAKSLGKVSDRILVSFEQGFKLDSGRAGMRGIFKDGITLS